MSITRFTKFLLAVALLLGVATSASAQHYQPFVDHDRFHPDLQFFAPADIEEYGGEPQAATGFFFDYSRLFIYVSRSEQEQSSTQMDHCWGNRFDFGFMNSEDDGWLFSAWHIDGPQANDFRYVERLNQFRTNTPAQGGGNNQNQTQLALFPSTVRNEAETNERVLPLRNSQNVADLTSFEINKTFRLAPLHNGGFMEPFLGARYIKFIDFTERDTYARFDATGVPVGDLPPPGAATARIEQFTADNYATINYMFGGQMGMRSYLQRSRWTLSNEIRFFAMQNFQEFSRKTNTLTTTYGAIGAGTNDPTSNTYARATFYAHDSEFVWGGEVRADAAYALTRDIRFNLGFNFIDLGKGVGRGTNFNRNSEDVQLVGINFGFVVNR